MSNKILLRQYHIQLWTWLAENPEMGKEDWLGWDSLTDLLNASSHLRNFSCFACTIRSYEEPDECGKLCPMDWGIDSNKNPCIKGSYGNWIIAKPRKRSEIAKQIANLWPENIDIEFDSETREFHRVEL